MKGLRDYNIVDLELEMKEFFRLRESEEKAKNEYSVAKGKLDQAELIYTEIKDKIQFKEQKILQIIKEMAKK